jgi:DNA-binding NtrC family response regulator
LQPKLLRVLERREVVRVGSREVRPVSIRVVSATWRDLRAMVNAQRFREDLYYRLAQARVSIPPLHERPDDVAMLVSHFLKGRPADTPGARGIAAEALEELCRRDYPGNVRELKSVVERAAATAEGPVITVADLAFERMLLGECRRVDAQQASPVARASHETDDETLAPYKEAKRSVTDEFERKYLERLLERSGRNVTRAAQLAGLQRHSLRDLFRKHRLHVSDG